MIVWKIIFTVLLMAILAALITFYLGLFGLVPYQLADFCATFVMTCMLIIVVVAILAMIIYPICKMWRLIK